MVVVMCGVSGFRISELILVACAYIALRAIRVCRYSIAGSVIAPAIQRRVRPI